MQKSNLGFGLGLRAQHYNDILQYQPAVDYFEVLTENYLIPGGPELQILEKIRGDYPIVMHGVSLSVGSVDPLDFDYLRQVKNLADRIQAEWISDHLCWTGVKGINTHELLPLPYTQECIEHVARRILDVQDYLQRQVLLENVASYISFPDAEMSEWEFLSAVAQKADCLILLDINNICVNAHNHGYNCRDYINRIPIDRVYQFHLAGHSNQSNYLIDSHDTAVSSLVWELYSTALERFGAVSTLIERDEQVPPLSELYNELQQARQIQRELVLEVQG